MINSEQKKMKELLDKVVRESKKKGLSVDDKKTKFIVVG